MKVKAPKKSVLTPTPRQKKLGKLLFNRATDDRLISLTDRDLTDMAGYKSKKPTTNIIRARGVQQALAEYMKQPKKVENRLKAKMLRNLDSGLDDDDEMRKLQYTTLQVKRDEAERKAQAVVVTENVNMLSILGLSKS